MKNWEKILEIYKKYTPESVYAVGREKIYPIISKEIVKEVIKEWDYENYSSEEAHFSDEFRTQFSSFLYRVKNWSQDKLKKSNFYITDYVRDDCVEREMKWVKGTRTFELWLLGDADVDTDISTNNKEDVKKINTMTIEPGEDLTIEKAREIMYKYEEGKHFAYLMYLYGENSDIPLYLKVGKSSNIIARKQQLIHQYNLNDIVIIKTFEFKDEETAEMMESFMRKYFKIKYQGKNFTPKDRFEHGICSDKDLIYFEKKSKLIAAAAEI